VLDHTVEEGNLLDGPQLALAMERVPRTASLDAGVQASWVTADEVYGADPDLRLDLEIAV